MVLTKKKHQQTAFKQSTCIRSVSRKNKNSYVFLSEVKEIIHKEIPESNNANGYQFRQIEIQFQLVV